MELIVLGRSGGFPMPGEATSGYLLRHGDTTVLVDCGSGVLSNLFRYVPVTGLSALVLSHLHSDHQADVSVLKYALNMTRRFGTAVADLPVYLPARPEGLVPTADGVLDLRFYEDGDPFEIGGIGVTCIAGDHPVPSYGMRFACEGKTLAYTGDTRLCPNVARMLQGADLAVMDAGGLERLRSDPMVHMTALECAQTAREAGVRRTLLSHLVPFQPMEETLREAQGGFDRVELAMPLASYIL